MVIPGVWEQGCIWGWVSSGNCDEKIDTGGHKCCWWSQVLLVVTSAAGGHKCCWWS